MKTVIALIGMILAAAAHPLQSQQQEPAPEFAKHLFAPELVLKHTRQIELQPAQRTALMQALREVQVEVVDLQLQMAEVAGDLTAEVEKVKVDEAAAMRLTDRILSLERDIKKRQMTLLIRIKNLLTPNQQERLAALRDREARQENEPE